jgi:hypothetical protein
MGLRASAVQQLWLADFIGDLALKGMVRRA